MVDAVFSSHGVAALFIGARAKPALYRLAYLYVFELYLVAELDRSAHGLLSLLRLGLKKIPLEDGQRAFSAERNNQVRGVVVGIDVEHQVREYPEILRFIPARLLVNLQARGLAQSGSYALGRAPRLVRQLQLESLR